MYLRKSVFFTLSFLTLSSFVSASDTKGELLTQKHCASCHLMTAPTPEQMQTVKAPPFGAVLFHAKDDLQTSKKVKQHIMNFVFDPKASQSVCESNKVQQFGLMPSLKGVVSEEELSIISDYLIETYPSKKFVKLISKMLADGEVNGLKNSPFLMNQEELPHLTKLLMNHWDKAKLGLNDKQKSKLLVVRKETMTGVKRIKKALKRLNQEVIELAYEGEELSKVKIKVDEIAKLKAEATMVQLKCLKDSIAILTDEQLEFLLPFWDA